MSQSAAIEVGIAGREARHGEPPPVELQAGLPGASALGDGDLVLFQGDSLTDGGRLISRDGLGTAWPASVRRLLEPAASGGARVSRGPGDPGAFAAAGGPAVRPGDGRSDHGPGRAGARLRLVNRAVAGDRSVDLLARWERDCLALRPDVVSILVGANDLWRKFVPWNGQEPVGPEDFRDNLDRLARSARNAGARLIVLCTPPPLHPDPRHPWNLELQAYREACGLVASAPGRLLAPLGEEFAEAMRHFPEVRWTHDGVHPRPIGHERLARSWLSALGCAAPLPPEQLPEKPEGFRLGRWP